MCVCWVTPQDDFKLMCEMLYLDGKHVHTVSIWKKYGEGMVFNY
jgi:hypothetical protein